jgi:hypothetical protein
MPLRQVTHAIALFCPRPVAPSSMPVPNPVARARRLACDCHFPRRNRCAMDEGVLATASFRADKRHRQQCCLSNDHGPNRSPRVRQSQSMTCLCFCCKLPTIVLTKTCTVRIRIVSKWCRSCRCKFDGRQSDRIHLDKCLESVRRSGNHLVGCMSRHGNAFVTTGFFIGMVARQTAKRKSSQEIGVAKPLPSCRALSSAAGRASRPARAPKTDVRVCRSKQQELVTRGQFSFSR